MESNNYTAPKVEYIEINIEQAVFSSSGFGVMDYQEENPI